MHNVSFPWSELAQPWNQTKNCQTKHSWWRLDKKLKLHLVFWIVKCQIQKIQKFLIKTEDHDHALLADKHINNLTRRGNQTEHLSLKRKKGCLAISDQSLTTDEALVLPILPHSVHKKDSKYKHLLMYRRHSWQPRKKDCNMAIYFAKKQS